MLRVSRTVYSRTPSPTMTLTIPSPKSKTTPTTPTSPPDLTSPAPLSPTTQPHPPSPSKTKLPKPRGPTSNPPRRLGRAGSKAGAGVAPNPWSPMSTRGTKEGGLTEMMIFLMMERLLSREVGGRRRGLGWWARRGRRSRLELVVVREICVSRWWCFEEV